MSESNAEKVAKLSAEEQAEIFKGFTEEQMEDLLYDADFWLRPEQKIPDGDWAITALVCGRGWGKTKAISEWVRRKALSEPGCRIGLAGKTAADVRDVVVEGVSGILAVHKPEERPEYKPSIRRVEWANGSSATLLSSESPDQGRGPGYNYVVMDEFAAWKEIRDDGGATLYSNLVAACRVGKNPQMVLATTPKRTPTMRKLLEDAEDPAARIVIVRGKTTDNTTLSADYIDTFKRQYAGSPNLYKQELEGLMIEDSEGLVFTQQMIEDSRITNSQFPSFQKYPLRVVSVDPTVSGEPRDECGIIVIGATVHRKPSDREAVILADESFRARPEVWAKRVVAVAREWNTKFIIVEKNQGHDLIRSTIHAEDPSLIIFPVQAVKGKLLRSEPVALAMSQRRVKFWGSYPELEDQMLFYDPASKSSPDRMDAMVWGIISTIIDPPSGLYTSHTSITPPRKPMPTGRIRSTRIFNPQSRQGPSQR